MKKMKNLLICAALLLVSAGCQGIQTPPAGVQDPAEAETEPQDSVIASPAEFSSLKDGDRILLMNPKFKRVFMSLRSKDSVAGAWPVSNGIDITGIPEYTAVLTYEAAENGTFRIVSDEGYLRTDQNGSVLEYGEKDEYSLWKCGDNGTVISCAAESEKGEELGIYYYYDDNVFELRPLREEYEENETLKPFLVKGSYEPLIDDGTGYRLPVFETSDVHGYLAESGEENMEYLLSWIADKVDDCRKRFGTNRDETVMLLDGGDIYQGNMLSNLLDGEPLSEAYAVMRYDAVTIGNHEFDWKIETVIDDDRTMADYKTKTGETAENRIPVVLCNLYQNGGKVPFAQDYIVLEKTAVDENGNELPVRIGVIGYADDFSPSIKYSLFAGAGYEIQNETQVLTELSEKLREEEHCDAVVLLSHTDAPVIGELVPPEAKIDLILAGHMHRDDIGLNANGIPFAAPGGYASSYCYGELVFEKGEDGTAEYERTAHLRTVPVDRTEALGNDGFVSDALNPELAALSDQTAAALSDKMKEKIGTITESVTRYDYFPGSGGRSSSGGNFHCDLIRRITDADVGVYNAFGMREDLLVPEGRDHRDILVGDVLSLFPFGNRICKFRLTYEEFMRYLDYAMTEAGAKAFTMISGIDVYYENGVVNAIIRDGTPLYADGEWKIDEKTETLTVAVSEFSASRSLPDSGLDNPFVEWTNTSRLVEQDKVDNFSAIEVLKEIADANGGVIPVDTDSHFINGTYGN